MSLFLVFLFSTRKEKQAGVVLKDFIGLTFFFLNQLSTVLIYLQYRSE